jgi:RNA polymerase sigma-70 factor (ECF subfamily)
MSQAIRGRDSGFFGTRDTNADPYETDLGLLEGLLMNEHAAWTTFQQRYDRLVESCIGRVLRKFQRRVSLEDAREVRASFYLALVQNEMHKLRAFDPSRGCKLGTFIGMIATNCAHDHLRSIRREPMKDVIGEGALDVESEEPSPFEHTSHKERAALCGKVLADFSDKDRDFATLYFIDGMEPEEIAARMNISVKTVYTKKHKIQQKLGMLFVRHAA